MQELRDAKGFRSPYINDLNAAVKSAHIIGGDVVPVESVDGTKLYIEGAPDRVRFRLFYGIKVDGSQSTDVLCCGVGSVFIGGAQTAIEVGNNVLWADSALMPRGQGWYTDQDVRYGEGITWALVELTATHTVYIIACPESQDYWQCVPGAADKSAIALIAVIGTFGAEASKQLTVTQLVTSDIVYAGTGGGGGSDDSSNPKYWQVGIDEDTQNWQIFSPVWMVENETLLPEGVTFGKWAPLKDVPSADTPGTSYLFAYLKWDEQVGSTGVARVYTVAYQWGKRPTAAAGEHIIVVPIGEMITTKGDTEGKNKQRFYQETDGAIVEKLPLSLRDSEVVLSLNMSDDGKSVNYSSVNLKLPFYKDSDVKTGSYPIGGSDPKTAYVVGAPHIIKEGTSEYSAKYFEVAYFCTVQTDSVTGLPTGLSEVLGKDGKKIEAWRVQVATHVSDHTNGVINGPL